MKIVVVLGGNTPEREVSLRSGAGIGRALIELGHDVTLLDTGTGQYLPSPEAAMALGTAKSAAAIAAAPGGSATAAAIQGATGGLDTYARSLPRAADLVFIALHGGDGEDGTLQAVLDLAGIPYTGSGMMASAVSMDKSLTKRIFRDAGIPTPAWVEATAPADPAAPWRPAIDEAAIAGLGGYPVIVKPNDQGSSVGISIVRGPAELLPAIEAARRFSRIVVVESFIEGREVTVTVLDDRPFPVVEIIPEGGFYDYERKYTSGASRYVVPAELDAAATGRLQALAVAACAVLRCRGVARVDFRLAEDGTPYCLEVNTVPGMTETSLVPKSAGAAGMSYRDLVRAIVEAVPAARAAR
ncbi:MAG: D-alanine--D-alanine ligase [Hyphomicrobiales bacterium]